MYELTIRDYLKCAHSLKGDIFGPAQLMHVVTYEVEVSYVTETLNEHELIVDFATAQSSLGNLMAEIGFKNLDDLEQFEGKNTTTEFLCRYIHGRIADEVSGEFGGKLRVTLRESPVAWVAYEAPVTS